MNKQKIIKLMILGRDRIYIELEQIQKAIELTKEAGLTDVVSMLLYKEDEVKKEKNSASDIIKEFEEGSWGGIDYK